MSRTVFLIAGEPSGDLLGARLMAALRRLSPEDIRFAGIGGEKMIEQGMASLFPMAELSVMGLAEVLPRLPNLLRRIRETAGEVERLKPDAVVTIDAPDFGLRVAKRLKGRGTPLIHYVAPSVWAWRPGRARKLARLLDHLLALFPFEPPYFTREGLACTAVGHPVVEAGIGEGRGDRFRAAHGVAPGAPVVCVLPGSRMGEVTKLLPVFSEAVARLAFRHPDLVAVVPTLGTVAATVAEAVQRWPLRTIVVRGDRDKYDAYAAADAALAASGTVVLELAMARLPAVIAYRVAPATAFLARRLLTVRHVSLVNILLDRPLMPELLQEECRPDRLAEEVGRLLADPAARQAQLDGLDTVGALLGEGGPPPSERAAQAVLRVLAERRPIANVLADIGEAP